MALEHPRPFMTETFYGHQFFTLSLFFYLADIINFSVLTFGINFFTRLKILSINFLVAFHPRECQKFIPSTISLDFQFLHKISYACTHS